MCLDCTISLNHINSYINMKPINCKHLVGTMETLKVKIEISLDL